MANIVESQPSPEQRAYADAFLAQIAELGQVLPESLVDAISALASRTQQLPFAAVQDAIDQHSTVKTG